MLNLATSIAVPNIQRIRVDAVQFDGINNIANVTVSIQAGGAGIVYRTVTILVSDGFSQGIRAKASPVGFDDRIELFGLATPTGFSDLVAASTGGIGARHKAAESVLLAAGLLPAGTVS